MKNLIILFSISASLTFSTAKNAYGDSCTFQCLHTFDQILAKENNLGGSQIGDFTAYCDKKNGYVSSGYPNSACIENDASIVNVFYCTKEITITHTVTKSGANSFEASQNARQACVESFFNATPNCNTYVPGSGAYSEGQMNCR